LSRFQFAAVLTDHPDLDYKRLAEIVPSVYDARGVYRRLGVNAENVEALIWPAAAYGRPVRLWGST
jgi:hypothetical protein